MIAGSTSFRGLLQLALVDRRLHQLVVEPTAVSVPSHSMWSRYPPVEFVVVWDALEGAMFPCAVRVGSDRFGCMRRGMEYVSSLLSVLCHVSWLRLDFEGRTSGTQCAVPLDTSTLFSALRHFKQLRSLAVHRSTFVAADELAGALDSLPSLHNLEMCADISLRGNLIASLHRLCSSQLDHATFSYKLLHRVVTTHDGTRAVKPRLRSLTVPLMEPPYLNHNINDVRDEVTRSCNTHFPSLLRPVL